MKALLPFALAVDKLNEKIGLAAAMCVLLAALISAANALSRFIISVSSNAFLEIQWYLFSAAVLLGGAIVLKLNEHVRVDLIYGSRSVRTRTWIDILGLVFFLIPSMLMLIYLSYPFFLNSFQHGEMSSNAGGLIRWPAKILMPIGFALVALQGFSELIKRVCFMQGTYDMDIHYDRPVQ
jgi:TRAP-type mannitol/chloroaromatic compound transport system permease small subunit